MGWKKIVPSVGISNGNMAKWSVVVIKIKKWIHSWMRPGYVEDVDKYNISKHLLEKFVCSLPVLGIIDGHSFMVRSILKFLNGHVYTWETLFQFFRRKQIRHFDTAYSSAHEQSNHGMKSHSTAMKPTMDMDTSAEMINNQTDIKVAELEKMIYRNVHFRHIQCLQLPTAPYTVTSVQRVFLTK
jgi:hypothetical protein